jgi:hypothetical protein
LSRDESAQAAKQRADRPGMCVGDKPGKPGHRAIPKAGARSRRPGP